MEQGLVNAFLAKEDLNESDQMLRQNLVALNEMVQRLAQERTSAAENFQRKEQELLKVSGALENQLAMAVQTARRLGLEPLTPPPPETQQEVAEESE